MRRAAAGRGAPWPWSRWVLTAARTTWGGSSRAVPACTTCGGAVRWCSSGCPLIGSLPICWTAAWTWSGWGGVDALRDSCGPVRGDDPFDLPVGGRPVERLTSAVPGGDGQAARRGFVAAGLG